MIIPSSTFYGLIFLFTLLKLLDKFTLVMASFIAIVP
jgi:hypothetical protein